MQMSAVAIIAIIAACLMVSGGLAGNIFGLLIIEEVDRRKPELDLYSSFSRFGRRWDKGLEISRLYRNLYPNGKLHIYEMTCFSVAIVSWISLVILGLISIATSR